MPDYATTNYPTATRRGPNSKTTLMRAAIGPGEIVQVQGGHIIRATGRKDRHSKVYTAKGPRDRRVRLSAHTAIQFYDVQDRLGYDRPSKAVDWLIKKAKDAIDKLDHLPPFNPTRTPPLALEYPSNHLHHNEPLVGGGEEEEDLAMVEGREGNGCHSESSGYESIHQQIQHHHQQIGNGGGDGSRAAGLSLDSSNTSMVADTMRSFFPTSSTEHGQMNSIGFHQSYDPNTHCAHHHQDLGLSLHSFSVDPVAATSHTSFPSGFESTGSHNGWGVDQNHQQQQSEMGRFSRLLAWSCGSGGGFGSSPPQGVVVGNNSPAALLFGDRETLQSSFSHPQHQQSSIRAWDDLPPPMERQHHAGGISDHGFMAGFCIPEIQHHGINLPNKYNNTDNKTSSMSTDSSH